MVPVPGVDVLHHPPRSLRGRGARRILARAIPGGILPVVLALAVLVLVVPAAVSPAHSLEERHSWPSSSKSAVATLDRASLEYLDPGLRGGDAREFRFVVLGGQQALVGGEWQELLRRIALRAKADSTIRFLVDTGDIVRDGACSDAFWMHRAVLESVPALPYLPAVGNHEVRSNGRARARANTATYVQYLDPDLSADRLWYRKDVGRARILFLDSNDFVYGDRGDRRSAASPAPGSRAERQLAWLERELATGRAPGIATIVVMHHALLQTSSQGAAEARALWSYTHSGRTLPDILADGGVDLVLMGHTRTCERYVVERKDGARIMLVDLSGRPYPSLIAPGERARRSDNIRGGEAEFFSQRGWKNLDGWRISLEHAMDEHEMADQFGVVTVGADGGLLLDVCYLDDRAPEGVRAEKTVWVR
jgi:hypothetical protein